MTQLALQKTITAEADKSLTPIPTVKTISPEESQVIDTIVVPDITDTQTSLAPTSTSTQSPAPSFTSTTSIKLPFDDNFDGEKSQLWNELSGTWIINDGRYTGIGGTGVGWFWTKLEISDLSNFLLSVNTEIPHYGSANQGHFAIVVRASSSQQEKIGYVFGFIPSRASWSFVEESNRTSITSTYENVPAEADIEIMVNGDQYIAKVNGFERESISLSDFDLGWISLGLKCSTTCPSFDNFHLERLN